MFADNFTNPTDFINSLGGVIKRVTTATTPESCSDACEAETTCRAAYYDTTTAAGAIVSCFLYASKQDLDSNIQTGDTRTNAVKHRYFKEVVTAPCK